MRLREGLTMMRRLPLFPLIPLLPIALATGCIAMNVSSYRRLRRLEARLTEGQRPGSTRLATDEGVAPGVAAH